MQYSVEWRKLNSPAFLSFFEKRISKMESVRVKRKHFFHQNEILSSFFFICVNTYHTNTMKAKWSSKGNVQCSSQFFSFLDSVSQSERESCWFCSSSGGVICEWRIPLWVSIPYCRFRLLHTCTTTRVAPDMFECVLCNFPTDFFYVCYCFSLHFSADYVYLTARSQTMLNFMTDRERERPRQ